jgi:pilus assembly protein CpaB
MRRPVIFIALAAVLAVLAWVVVYSALRSREAETQRALAKNVEVVVAAYDLPLGTKIEPGELKLARWSSDSVPEGAYTDPKEIVGSYVKSTLATNEPVVANKLFLGEKTAGVMPLLIPFGMRAVSVPVDEVSDIAGFVLPHSRVDVLVAVSSSGSGIGAENKPFSKVVLQNVEVLAVAQEIEKKKDEPSVVKVVTLLVTPQEAERLTLANHEGILRLAMRNYNDNKIVLTSGSSVAQMLHAYSTEPESVPVISAQPSVRRAAAPRPRVRPFEIEILRNGKSSESVSFINGSQQASSTDDAAAPARSPAPAAGAGSADHDSAAPISPVSSNDSSSAGVPVSAPMSASALGAPPAGSRAAASGVMPALSTSSTDATYSPTPKTIEVP